MKKYLKSNRMLNNASWIVGCKIIQSLISFLIGTITARYLGPSNFGLINYAASLVAFVTPIMQLGFNETLVQEFIQEPEKSGKILGTSLVMNILAAIASIIGVCSFAIAVNEDNGVTIWVCFLYSLTLLFQATEMSVYWFQSQLLSKYTSVTSLIAHFIGAGYKTYLLISGKSVVWFALTHVIEACFISLALLILFRKYSKQRLSFSLKFGKELLLKSRHYIISGLMIVVFQQTDKIMLKFMTSAEEVGFYSSSLTCMAITGFVFMAIIDSARPWVLQGKLCSDTEFSRRLKVLFSIVHFVSLVQSIIMTVFAKPIVSILFGQEYLPAANVLKVAVWYTTFGYMGTIRNIWILANNKQKYLPFVNLSGALMNVVANYILIPRFGSVGAAVASLLTQLLANFLLCFVIKPIREAGMIMLQSTSPKFLLKILKRYLCQIKI